ncbi:MAG: hypothetical protein Q7I98_02205 [Erysipelotrichaceae bacterium]|nr:hypothetical protein [Erysipelotrichaceae bacterium]
MRKIIATGIILSLALLFNSCSDQTTTSTQVPAAQSLPASPIRTAEVYGKVTKIIGNEVTLSLAELQSETATLTEAEKAQKQATTQSLSIEERQKLKDLQIKYTGEKITIIIPVGTPIIAGGASGTGGGTGTNSGGVTPTSGTLTEVSLTDILEGTMLRIWLAEGGDGTEPIAEYTRVLQFLQ